MFVKEMVDEICKDEQGFFNAALLVSYSCFSYRICPLKNASHLISSKIYNKDVSF